MTATWKSHIKLLATAHGRSAAWSKMSQYRAETVPACFMQGEISCHPLVSVPSSPVRICQSWSSLNWTEYVHNLSGKYRRLGHWHHMRKKEWSEMNPGWCGSVHWASSYNLKVTSSIPSQGMCLSSDQVLSWGCARGNWSVFFSLSFIYSKYL